MTTCLTFAVCLLQVAAAQSPEQHTRTAIVKAWQRQADESAAPELHLDVVRDSRTRHFGISKQLQSFERWQIRLDEERLLVAGKRFEVTGREGRKRLLVESPAQARREFRQYLLDERLESDRNSPSRASVVYDNKIDDFWKQESFGPLEEGLIGASLVALRPTSVIVVETLTVVKCEIDYPGGRCLRLEGETPDDRVIELWVDPDKEYRAMRMMIRRNHSDAITQADFEYAGRNEAVSRVAVQYLDAKGNVLGFLTAQESRSPGDRFIATTSPDSEAGPVSDFESVRRIAWRGVNGRFTPLVISLLPFAAIGLYRRFRRKYESIGRRSFVRLVFISAVALLALIVVRKSAMFTPTVDEAYRRLASISTEIVELQYRTADVEQPRELLSRVENELAVTSQELVQLRHAKLHWPWPGAVAKDDAEYR